MKTNRFTSLNFHALICVTHSVLYDHVEGIGFVILVVSKYYNRTKYF